MRRYLIIFLLVLLIPFALSRLLGVALWHIPTALTEGAALGAKLACSGYYLSGFTLEKNQQDIASYSSLLDGIELALLPEQGVEGTLFGLASAQAMYRPGIGCALEYSGYTQLDSLTGPAPVKAVGDWPAGSSTAPYQAQLQALLEKQLQLDATEGLDTRALLIAHRGELVAESYAEGVDKMTPLLGWSMAKSVTAILLGRLESMGLLEPRETNLFPSWQDDERSDISLQNMLQMSSGLAFAEEYWPGNDSTSMLLDSPSASDVALAKPLEAKPGQHFAYSSGTTNILARLISERLGGEPSAFLDFLGAEIIQPLGLENSILELDASGMFVGSSFVYASARDWARLGQLMLNGGVLNGRRLLSEDWVRRAATPNTSDNDPRYGYQFWLNDGAEALRWPSLPKDAYAMQGNRAQVVMIIPSAEAVIVRLGWTAGEYPTDQRFAQILKQATSQPLKPQSL